MSMWHWRTIHRVSVSIRGAWAASTAYVCYTKVGAGLLSSCSMQSVFVHVLEHTLFGSGCIHESARQICRAVTWRRISISDWSRTARQDSMAAR